jgi:catechol 2,3-dioxygenase
VSTGSAHPARRAGPLAVLTGGRTHRELLLIEVSDAPGPLQGRRIGLCRSWKVGKSIHALRQARDRALERGYPIAGVADHAVSQSLCLRDPAGNEIELFVDDLRVSKEWMESLVKPLKL